MKKSIVFVLLLSIVSLVSCSNDEKNVDFKLVYLDYNFDNYQKNVRPKSNPIIIKERNIVEIDIDSIGNVIIEKKNIPSEQIIKKLKRYIKANPKNEKMPSTITRSFEYSGDVIVTKNLLVSALFNKNIDFVKYLEIRRNIFMAFTEVRNEFALNNFNTTLFELGNSDNEEDNTIYQEIVTIFPINYLENQH